MASLSKCNVCMEEFTKEGERCPKLLPCTHTVCQSCINRLGGNQLKGNQLRGYQFRGGDMMRGFYVRCPECRQDHQIPNGGPKGFPTNRYVLEILDLIKASQQQKRQPKKEEPKEKPVLCESDEKPCVMFCLEKECWKLLCPKCPLQDHQEHNVVSFAECLNDFDQLKQMKQAVVDEITLLDAHQRIVGENRFRVSRESEQAQKAIHKKAQELKQAIDKNAEEFKRNIQQQSNEQVKKLEATLGNINLQSSVGKQLKYDIENRPLKDVSQAIQHLAKLNKKFVCFKQSSKKERDKQLSYDLVRFKIAETHGLTPEFLGEIQTTRQSFSPSNEYTQREDH